MNCKTNYASYSIPTANLTNPSQVDELTCVICLNICFKPLMVTCCDRIICFECLLEMTKNMSTIKCPYCNNINFTVTKPPKLIFRLFENLTFNCPNQGCLEKIKYYFYHDHIYNQCSMRVSPYSFCKSCLIIDDKHNCNEYRETIDNEEMSKFERELYDVLDVKKESQLKQSSTSTTELPRGTVNIPLYFELFTCLGYIFTILF